jgi:hypothetical protein
MPMKRTPWGLADSCEPPLPNGIQFFSTPSHGGYWVPRKLLPQIPAAYRAYAKKWSQSEQWYEEDVAWMCLVRTFPQFWNTADVAMAQDTHWLPEAE